MKEGSIMPLVVDDIKLYSVRELSEMLGITTATILTYIKSGRLKAQKIGGRWQIASDNLREFLTGNPAETKKKEYPEGFSTARSLLKFAGTWAGNDAEEVLKRIIETRSKAEF